MTSMSISWPSQLAYADRIPWSRCSAVLGRRDWARSVPEVSSRRPVQTRSTPWRGLVLPHVEHAAGRLDLGPDAPAGNESTRERRICEVDRHRVVEHPARSGRGRGPTVGAAILVEPGGHLSITPAEPVGRNADPNADGKSPLGRNDYDARITLTAGERRLEVMRGAFLPFWAKDTSKRAQNRRLSEARASLFPLGRISA